MPATRVVSLWGRLSAVADSVFGETAPLANRPLSSAPSSAEVWEATVSEVAPVPMKWLMTEAGMVTWAARAVEKVPPASMVAGGAGDSDITTGKLVVPEVSGDGARVAGSERGGAVEGGPEQGQGEPVAVVDGAEHA